MIVPSQSRGARAMLRWTVAELAQRAEVAPNTIVRFEAEKSVNTGTVAAIQGALEAAGVEFLPDNGVRLHATATISVASGMSRKKTSATLPIDRVEESSVRSPSAGPDKVSQVATPAPDQPAESGNSKPRRPRAKPLLMSKEAQIRALREREVER